MKIKQVVVNLLATVIISYFNFSCKSIEYYYCKDDELDSNSKEILEKAIKIDSNEIAILLNGEAFVDNKLIIFSKNKIDTMKRFNESDFDQPTIAKKFKNNEKIRLKHNGSSIKIKIKSEYKYIRISKSKNNWYVTYCPYPLVY